jgi:hypothetical protein
MKYRIRLIARLLTILSSFLGHSYTAKSIELLPKLSLYCETNSIYYSYSDNISYIKDLHSHSRDLYNEKFRIDLLSSDRAVKKHANDMIADEEYSVTKVRSLYKLKSIKGTNDFSAVIDLSNRKYSSVSEKSDTLIRIKAQGTCIERR